MLTASTGLFFLVLLGALVLDNKTHRTSYSFSVSTVSKGTVQKCKIEEQGRITELKSLQNYCVHLPAANTFHRDTRQISLTNLILRASFKDFLQWRVYSLWELLWSIVSGPYLLHPP